MPTSFQILHREVSPGVDIRTKCPFLVEINLLDFNFFLTETHF